MYRDDDPLLERIKFPFDNDYVIAACFPTFPNSLFPRWFSCDWHKWTKIYCLFPQWDRHPWSNNNHRLGRFPAVLHHVFKITGTPRPLAFLDAPTVNILFAVGAEYYFWNGDDGELHRFGSGFVSDTDFLLRVRDTHSFDDICVPECINWNYNKIYLNVDKESALKVSGRRS
ncbi:hypothetical protein DFH06DRAFT_1332806 [Mycena polygramma]|nr:hypothetical protein DFH06DRAFT_1332806 [Mycena polygramma]